MRRARDHLRAGGRRRLGRLLRPVRRAGRGTAHVRLPPRAVLAPGHGQDRRRECRRPRRDGASPARRRGRARGRRGFRLHRAAVPDHPPVAGRPRRARPGRRPRHRLRGTGGTGGRPGGLRTPRRADPRNPARPPAGPGRPAPGHRRHPGRAGTPYVRRVRARRAHRLRRRLVRPPLDPARQRHSRPRRPAGRPGRTLPGLLRVAAARRTRATARAALRVPGRRRS